jgi:hypothetical protein
MHTRDALNSTAAGTAQYGTIVEYYRPVNGSINYSIAANITNNDILSRSPAPQQSINAQQLSTTYSFTQQELAQIAYSITQIPEPVVSGFEEKYLAWEKEAEEHPWFASPAHYSRLESYEDILSYCKKFGIAVYPLVFDKIKLGDWLVINLIGGLTFTGSSFDFLHYINSIDFPGGTNPRLIYYCQLILANEYNDILEAARNIITSIQHVDTQANFSVIAGADQKITINFFSGSDEPASIKIYTVLGVLIHQTECNVSAGMQTVVINASRFNKGVYIVQTTIGGKTKSQKIYL